MSHTLFDFTEPSTGLKFRLRAGTSDREVIREAIEDNVYRLISDPSPGVIVDIGANIGAFTLFAAKMFPNKRIFAYEPEPDNRSCLESNVMMNRLIGRVSIRGIAVAGVRGTQTITQQQGNSRLDSTPQDVSQSSQSAARINCESVTLEDVLADNFIDECSLLKLDAEGSEFDILNAPPRVLRKFERLAMETHWFTPQRWQEFTDRLSLTHTFRVEPGYIFATVKP